MAVGTRTVKTNRPPFAPKNGAQPVSRTRTTQPPPPPPDDDDELSAADVPDQVTSPADADDPDFVIWNSQWTDDDWQQMIGYLWRVEPITDRRNGGRPTSVDKIARPFDLDAIMRQHGSGRYRVDICRIPPNGGKQTRIRQSYFTIMNMDHPPRVPPGDWVEDPRNENWKWGSTKSQTSSAESAADPNKLFRTVFEATQQIRGNRDDNNSVTQQVIDLARESRDQLAQLANPETQLATIKNLLALAAPKSDPEAGGMKLVVTMMERMLDNQAKEIQSLREQINKPGPSLKERLEEITGVIGLLGKGKSVGTDWGEVINNAIEKLAPAVPALVFAMTQPKPAPAPAGAAPQPQQPPPAAIPSTAAAPPAGAPPQPAAAPPPAAATAPPPQYANFTPEQMEAEKTLIQQLLLKHGAVIQWSVPFMIDHFIHLTGYDLRDLFIERQGKARWEELRKDAGGPDAAQRIAGMVMLNPDLAAKLQPQEKFIAFMTGFFTDPGAEPKEDLNDNEPSN